VSLTMGAANDSITILGGTVTVDGGAGIDTVRAALSYTLGANTENLTLLGSAAINGTGNGLANTITGNGAANILNGGLGNDTLDGGLGADTLIGGAGNDTYVINSTADVLQDSAGVDLVKSTVAKTLAAAFENLTLLGTSAINGTGNAANNIITGNAGANTLTGLGGNDRLIGGNGNDIMDGGAGLDRLEGAAGNDTYTIDSASEMLVELSGIDLVRSTVTKTLATGFENLTLLGTSAINGTGNALNNTITGNGAVNTLTGLAGNDTINAGAGNDVMMGGLGRDVVTGGAGDDRFDFNTAAEVGTGATRDVITDFIHLHDKIDFATIDANGAAAGHTFTFLAAKGAAFTGVAGQLRWFQQDFADNASDRAIVEGDINGDKVADLQLQLTGLKTLTAADFIL
jgi:Ca2+-binding RTX toxin-like protein